MNGALDNWLNIKFKEEYNQQCEILKKLGLLNILPKSGKMGIIGIDGKEYPFPRKETIEQEIKNNREVYEIKLAQGFSQIQLIPFALSIDKLIEVLSRKRIRICWLECAVG